MKELNFEFQAKNVPEATKIEYQEKVKQKFPGKSGNVFVSWTGDPSRLRGLLIADA